MQEDTAEGPWVPLRRSVSDGLVGQAVRGGASLSHTPDSQTTLESKSIESK